MKDVKIVLVINPGSTSTKTALFSAGNARTVDRTAGANIQHEPAELDTFADPGDQLPLRAAAVETFLKESGSPSLDAIAGRGGLTRPLEAGSYRINPAMKEDLLAARYGNHASNLGALIADHLAAERGIPALIADPVGVDQFEPLARYSGHPEIERRCQLHALNMRAVARETARERGGTLDDSTFIVAHLGGGISISPIVKGRLVDVNHAMDGGPFSPQRTGGLPTIPLVEMCFSGRWKNVREAKDELTRRSGLLGYLGTDDGKEIEERAVAGEEPWREVYRAMAYQISKEIGSMAAVCRGLVDAIILTGGLAHPPLTDWITESVDWIAPVIRKPGEREMEALALAAARYLFGEEELQDY